MKVRDCIVAMASLAAVGVLTASSRAAAVNLVANPSFESPALASGAEGGVPTGWNGYNAVFTENVVGTGLQAHEGVQNVKTYGNGGLFQDIPATPGQTYNASAWAEILSSDPPTSYMGGQLILDFRNAANTGSVGNAAVVAIVTDATPTRDAYLQGTLTGTVPAGVGFIRFQLNQYTGGGGAVFFDDTSLTLAAVPEPASLAAVGLAGAGLVARRRRR